MIIILIPFSEIYLIKLTEKLNLSFLLNQEVYVAIYKNELIYIACMIQEFNPYHTAPKKVVKTVINFDFRSSLRYFKKLMKAFVTLIKPLSGTTNGTFNGMLVATLLENKASKCFNFLLSYRFVA